MSPFSASAFIVLGFALASMRRKSLGWAAQSAAAVVIVIGVVTIAGYLWNSGISVRDPQLPPIAINTAACFTLLGVGILLSPSGPGVGFDTQITALAAVEVKILAGFLFAMSLLLFGGSYTYRTSVEFAASVDWISHTQEVRKSLADVYGAFAGAELAQRDFLLTGSQSRRDDYLRLARITQDHLVELERLTGENPEQQANLAALKSAIAGRFGYLASVVAAYQNYGLPAAQAVLAEARPNSNVRTVRLAVERLDAAEVGLLSARQVESARDRRTTFASLLITLGCASALFTALFRGIHREMRARRDAERALRVLLGLKSEGVEPTLILWALVRELRGLWQARERDRLRSADRGSGWNLAATPSPRALSRLKTLPLPRLLIQAGRTDRVIKGLAPGDAWSALTGLTGGLAGALQASTESGRVPV